MPLLLDIPYRDKDEAKLLGARWNPNLKKWYAPRKADYVKFYKWLLQDDNTTDIICDNIYIVESQRECFKCHKITKVICLGIDSFLIIINADNKEDFPHIYEKISGIIISPLLCETLPNSLIEYLHDKYKYYFDYSKTIDDVYYANHCQHCGTIQGNNFLFSRYVKDAPFYINEKEKAKKLIIYKAKLKYDLIANIDIRELYMEQNINMAISEFIEGYSTIINTDLIF